MVLRSLGHRFDQLWRIAALSRSCRPRPWSHGSLVANLNLVKKGET